MPPGFDPPLPGGMTGNSPTFPRWGCVLRGAQVPKGRLNPGTIRQPSLRDLSGRGRRSPTLKRWAIIAGPSGTMTWPGVLWNQILAALDRKTTPRLLASRTPGVCRLASLVILACLCQSISAAELHIGQATASAGTAVSVPVTCEGASDAVGAQFDLSYDPALASLTGTSAGEALAGHVVDQQQLAPGLWRALVYSTTNGPIATGAVVWLSFNIPANTPDGVVPLTVANAILAKPAGQRAQPLTQVSGALTVSSPRDLLAIATAGNGQLRGTITGVPGRAFTLQGTPDFFHWADLGRYTNQTGTLVLTNYLQAGRNAYFYRTVFRPGTNPPTVPAPSLADALLLPDGRMRFQLNSAAGSAWRVQGSPDLFHWGNYGVLTNQTGALQITNMPHMKPAEYFFRAAQP